MVTAETTHHESNGVRTRAAYLFERDRDGGGVGGFSTHVWLSAQLEHCHRSGLKAVRSGREYARTFCFQFCVYERDSVMF